MRYKVEGNIHLWAWTDFKIAIKGKIVNYKTKDNIIYWIEFDTEEDNQSVEALIKEYELKLCNNNAPNDKNNNIQDSNEPMTFYKLSEEKQELITNWISNNFIKVKTIYKDKTSFELKNLFKDFSISNGEYKGAMDKCGFRYELNGEVNWCFNISKKSPVFPLLSMNIKLEYAIKDKTLVHISEVQNGINCNCYCPSCGGKLVAKKGKKNSHHFSHYNSEECQSGYETSLHMAAKNIIFKRKEFIIPDVYLNFPNSYKESEKIYDGKMIKIDNVYLEKKVDNVIPDIIIESSGKQLLVEIYVTHKVDDDKLKKIKKIGISTIEIDLSKIGVGISKEEFENLIIGGVEQKKWLYNLVEYKYYNKFKEMAKPFEETNNGNGNYCPIDKYFWNGISSARWEDCVECEYCFSTHESPSCLGYTLISKIEDLKRSKVILEKEYNEKKRRREIELIERGLCPKCSNGTLVKREGVYGTFTGCNNYPHCKYIYKLI